jgi:hypothetical protein
MSPLGQPEANAVLCKKCIKKNKYKHHGRSIDTFQYIRLKLLLTVIPIRMPELAFLENTSIATV